MLSSFQRGDCLSGIVTYFGPVVIRLFRLATAVESSERRKTHNVRLVPFPNAYAPAMPLRAKASRWRRLIDRNCAAASADTKGSGVMGFISFSRVPVGLRRSPFWPTRTDARNGFSSALVNFNSGSSQPARSGECCQGTVGDRMHLLAIWRI